MEELAMKHLVSKPILLLMVFLTTSKFAQYVVVAGSVYKTISITNLAIKELVETHIEIDVKCFCLQRLQFSSVDG